MAAGRQEMEQREHPPAARTLIVPNSTSKNFLAGAVLFTQLNQVNQLHHPQALSKWRPSKEPSSS
jgi:hypothetical protein